MSLAVSRKPIGTPKVVELIISHAPTFINQLTISNNKSFPAGRSRTEKQPLIEIADIPSVGKSLP